jgi:hypothetical protein
MQLKLLKKKFNVKGNPIETIIEAIQCEGDIEMDIYYLLSSPNENPTTKAL